MFVLGRPPQTGWTGDLVWKFACERVDLRGGEEVSVRRGVLRTDNKLKKESKM